ncbi:diguanylate cyclase domain-containing protein [Marinobacter salarius]|uniref:diguanylate cyclase domain-containing protein n=1 Tax=Marinobacter salarius TaxID=1420917 RepID=UPI003D0A321C
MGPTIPPESFIDLLLDALCVVDRDGYVRYVSAASERVFGYLPEEMIGRRILDFVHPEDLEKTRQAVKEILRGELKPYFENRYIRKDGSTAHIMWSARWSEKEQIRVAVARDVTQRKRAEAMQAAMYVISNAANSSDSLPAMFRRIHQVVEGLMSAPAFMVALVDTQGGELYFPYNADRHETGIPGFSQDIGSLCEQVIRSAKALLLTPGSSVAFSPQAIDTSHVEVRHHWLGVPLKSSQGVFGAIAVQRQSKSACYTDEDRELLEFVGIQVAAAVERKQMQAQLEHMARYDQLTELPNRSLVLDRIQTALARAAREVGFLAILYLDLDDFKQVNDTYGHAVGDQVLQEMARRLVQGVRAADTVGRLGGDEFIVLLDGIEQPSDADSVAEKLRATLSEPYELPMASLTLIPSIGVAVYPEHGDNHEALIRYADSAMYRMKKGRPDPVS